jgi:hypothetical protein
MSDQSMRKKKNTRPFNCSHCKTIHWFIVATRVPDKCPITDEPFTKEEREDIATKKMLAKFDEGKPQPE